jgi:hypothetical protein
MNLRNLEGIVELLHIETGRMYLNIICDIEEYANKKQLEHPARERIQLYREYLANELIYNKVRE